MGRLALRVEGDFWNAYHARSTTMEGAVLLGSIRLSVVMASAAMKQTFIETMQGALGVAVEAVTGAQIDWPDPPQPAPEHERSGRA